MKIERLSENQIRCTLNKNDLASRQLKISELAYGSEKAKELFRDMMQQASYELGFEAEDIPLMIEAIPVSADCIVLIVTKVDNPEELDTRFSRFSPSIYDDSEDSDFPYPDMEDIGGGDNYTSSSRFLTAGEELDSEEASTKESPDDFLGSDLMNLFSKVKDYLNKGIQNNNSDKASDLNNNANGFVPLSDSFSKNPVKPEVKDKANIADNEGDSKANTKSACINRLFSFDNMDDICAAAKVVCTFYSDSNSLFKKPSDEKYYLVISKENCNSVNFNKLCNILSEYGTKENAGDNCAGYFKEHCECIIAGHAIKVLAKF